MDGLCKRRPRATLADSDKILRLVYGICASYVFRGTLKGCSSFAQVFTRSVGPGQEQRLLGVAFSLSLKNKKNHVGTVAYTSRSKELHTQLSEIFVFCYSLQAPYVWAQLGRWLLQVNKHVWCYYLSPETKLSCLDLCRELIRIYGGFTRSRHCTRK